MVFPLKALGSPSAGIGRDHINKMVYLGFQERNKGHLVKESQEVDSSILRAPPTQRT